MPESLSDALVDAAMFGRADRLVSLLGRGADPNQPSADGTTPLYAAVGGDPTCVRLLLDAGADPNFESRGETDGTPLCMAAAWGHSGVARELLSHGADPNQREDDGAAGSPLLWATRNGHVETVRLLLETGADPNLSCRGETPLVAAAESGSVAVVKLLLKHGASDQALPGTLSALQIAQEWSERDVAAELCNRLTAQGFGDVTVRRTSLEDGTEAITAESRTATGAGPYLEARDRACADCRAP
jgi:uncharacterized protein